MHGPNFTQALQILYHIHRTNPEAAQRFTDPDQTAAVLNELDWGGDPTLATTLQDSVLQSQRVGFCRPEIVSIGTTLRSRGPVMRLYFVGKLSSVLIFSVCL